MTTTLFFPQNNMQRNLLVGLVFGGQILFFSLMFTLLKVMSQTCVPALAGMTVGGGSSGKKCPVENDIKFERPVLNALMMVGSMSLALIYFFGFLKGKKNVEPVSRKSLVFIVLPACLDTVTCALLMAGSMFIPISLTLTLKGIRILFSSILVILIFNRKQKNYNWAGVAIAMLGVSMAALSAVLNNNAAGSAAGSDTSTTMLGIGLVVASEFFRSLMVVTQEYLIKVIKCDPSFMIGLQGVYGGILVVLLMILAWLAIPGKDVGNSFENLQSTFQLASQSSLIITILAILPLIVVLGFVCSAMVTKLLSSVHNAMASVTMTALAWLMELFIYYVVDKNYGNLWGPYSALQLVGFTLVVLALLVYDGTFIKLTWILEYPPQAVASKEEEEEEEVKVVEFENDISITDKPSS